MKISIMALFTQHGSSLLYTKESEGSLTLVVAIECQVMFDKQQPTLIIL